MLQRMSPLALLVLSSAALAQSAAVPPAKAKPGLGEHNQKVLEGAGEVVERKEQSMHGLAVTASALKDRSAARHLRKAADAYGTVGAVVSLADTVDAGLKGDEERLKENLVDAAQDLSVSALCSASGVPIQCNAVVGAYSAGTLVGDAISYAPKLIDPKNRTINEAWTDDYVFPAWTAMGCPGSESVFGVDSRYCGGQNSQAVRDAEREAARQRFENRSSALQSQQQEHDARQAAAAQFSTPASNPNDGSGFFDALSGALNAYSDYQQHMSTPTTAAPAASSGGCHPGHDEQAHPGGCHDYGGASSR